MRTEVNLTITFNHLAEVMTEWIADAGDTA
jgi:hypothetical protein